MDPNEQMTVESPRQGPDVTVTYNDVPTSIHRGSYSIAKLRDTLHVPPNEILAEFVDGAFKDVTTGHIVIKGGEVFASHLPQGGAS